MKSRWGLVLPGQLMLVEDEEAGKGGKETPRCWRRGHRRVWVVVCWIVFFNLSFFFKEKAPILCHHFYGICNSGKNLSLI